MTKEEIALQIFNVAVHGLNTKISNSCMSGGDKTDGVDKIVKTYAELYNTIYDTLTFSKE